LFKWPSTRPEFWRAKIGRNREKDSEVLTELKNRSYRVLVVWECALKGKTRLDFDTLISDIEHWVIKGKEDQTIAGIKC